MKSCLICDDHQLVREALAVSVKAAWPGVKIQLAKDFDEAQRFIGNGFDICLCDYKMPGATGIEGAKRLVATAPNAKIIIISGTAEITDVKRLLALGVSGFVPKTASAALIEAAIKVVQSGERFFPPDMILDAPELEIMASTGLSQKQALVLDLIAKGMTNKDIAKSLGVAPSTVKTHVEKLLQKFGATSRAKLAAIVGRPARDVRQ